MAIEIDIYSGFSQLHSMVIFNSQMLVITRPGIPCWPLGIPSCDSILWLVLSSRGNGDVQGAWRKESHCRWKCHQGAWGTPNAPELETLDTCCGRSESWSTTSMRRQKPSQRERRRCGRSWYLHLRAGNTASLETSGNFTRSERADSPSGRDGFPASKPSTEPNPWDMLRDTTGECRCRTDREGLCDHWEREGRGQRTLQVPCAVDTSVWSRWNEAGNLRELPAEGNLDKQKPE